MTSQGRKARGMKTQRIVADYMKARGWPFADSAGAGRSGSDILNIPDLAIEVKARTAFQPLAWLRQAATEDDGRLPMVVCRMNGQGEDAGEYLAFTKFGLLVPVLHAAGYGDTPDPIVMSC